MDFIANRGGQTLKNYSLAVAKLSLLICSKMTNNKAIQSVAYASGLLHDLGKVAPEFQGYIITQIGKKQKTTSFDDGEHIPNGKFGYQTHVTHNELSTYLFDILIEGDRSYQKSFFQALGIRSHSQEVISYLRHVLFWHHAQPFRKVPHKNMMSIYQKGVSGRVVELHELAQQYFDSFGINLPERKHSIHDSADFVNRTLQLPEYKFYSSDHSSIESFSDQIQFNAHCNILRLSLIQSDKIISSLSNSELIQRLDEGDFDDLVEVPESTVFIDEATSHSNNFHPDSQQTFDQKKAAKHLSMRSEISALSGPAGSGKTKVSVEWALLSGAKKLYWVVPRVSVGMGVFEELSSPDYLPGCRIELFTGETKVTKKEGVIEATCDDEHLSGDVIITTLDQMASGVITSNKIGIFMDFMSHHAVFDEFHEYSEMGPIGLVFAELIKGRSESGYANKTLLVSATPNYLYSSKVLGIDQSSFYKMISYNKSLYSVDIQTFSDTDPITPLNCPVDDGTFVISNTATIAQKSFIQNSEDPRARVFHSKFKPVDKINIFNEIYRSFKRNGTGEISTLRSGPIIQASLNISCRKMVSEASTPESTLQRMGRLDRFGVSSETNEFIIAASESVVSSKASDFYSRYLSNVYSLNKTNAWLDFLSKQNLKNISLADIYAYYDAFYQCSEYREQVEHDLLRNLCRSSSDIAKKQIDPVWVKPKALSKNSPGKVKRNSLRGTSRHVQMAVINVINGEIHFENEYALSDDEEMTYSLLGLIGDESVTNYMLKKHHQIDSFNESKPYNANVLIEKSRKPETPIYCSYIPSHLLCLNDSPEPYSIYYVKSQHSVVGAIKLDIILNL